ncbi:hypothetical protein DSO57_1013405 [Entomophthora muscae]|uniref:Uncharacterized protein n=1 Tax=Entomophthora muscae TaxID=34485 RepID=A0ACC2RWR1_9FUNG|nr:hypothetical protein DSO57_1013405 [Entomophthora muscae]
MDSCLIPQLGSFKVSKVSSLLKTEPPVTTEEFSPTDPAPRRTPWLLGSLVLMGLDSYLPQLSPASSLWTPLQVVIPVLYWIVS